MAMNPRQTIALIDLAIESSSDQTRLESALRRLDGLTLLEWSIRRLSESTLLDSIVVTGHPSQRRMLSSAGLCNAAWMPSAQATPAQRACEVAERLQAEWMVFINPQCPFLDPALMDRLISRGWAEPEHDFVGFVSLNQPSFSLQRLGLVAEMCSHSAIEAIHREGLETDPLDVPDLIRLHSELFQMKWLPLPTQLSQQSMQFRLETQEDWDRADSLIEAVGDDLSWQRLAAIAERNFS